ncbi:MAG: hypothetical protein ACRDBY_00795 [Cetobacterium sp.]
MMVLKEVKYLKEHDSRFSSKCTFYHFVNRDDVKTIRIDTLGVLVDFKDIVSVRIKLNDSNIDKLDDILIFRIRGFIIDKIDSHEETTVEELISEIKGLIISHGN